VIIFEPIQPFFWMMGMLSTLGSLGVLAHGNFGYGVLFLLLGICCAICGGPRDTP
jgi:NADH:ubiquinone oxidoreductase subunit 6 (subunit J)